MTKDPPIFHYKQYSYDALCSMGRMAKFTITIMMEKAGSSSSAVFRLAESTPAMDPMMGELTASPIQPKVITIPMAVAVMMGNASPTMASVVGNTGAMARPAQNTAIQARVGSALSSIK